MMKFRWWMGVGCVVLLTAGQGGCQGQPSSDQVQNARQEQMNQQAISEVGMPAVTRFNEKRFLKMVYELRDQMPPTYTYMVDMTGVLHKVCNSIGFGVDGATQYTSPQRPYVPYSTTGFTIPQADPNGLYSPATSEGSWIACLNPQDKQMFAMRLEPRMIVSPVKLKSRDDYLDYPDSH